MYTLFVTTTGSAWDQHLQRKDLDELIARDKASLDIFWLKDDSLEDSDNLPAPGIFAVEIVEDLESALEQMRLISEDIEEPADNST